MWGRLAEGSLTVTHYASLMRQIFHHALENPQIQALATVRFRGKQRRAVGEFYRHALSEIGHDQLALNDFAACGDDPATVPSEHPLPATTALISFAFHQIYNLNPVGYLGYRFFLESLLTSQGRGLIDLCKRIDVPDQAFTFLLDHTRIDVGHNRAMAHYCEQLATTDGDLQSVIYALRTTAILYAQMVEAAIDWVDNPIDYGLSPEESPRL